MLQIKQICKQYRTGDLIQKALDHVDLSLRDNEFVAILGPSGSGKTTLLNIIGGLDRYDSGELIINGISTKKYKDRDWDSYRNHTIGFVFQSYNLIPHQTILSNVELALTISGIGKGERKSRAVKALEQVGLGDQIHKKPNQLSGGQMQRVAIARALVNDPDILLADEPTGALDSNTSIQVMDLLREVAKDRLVVMVTHNPELAKQYATRIVSLRDGKIQSDTNPFYPDEKGEGAPMHKNMGKASMSFLTALSLSFHNLRTKKARTLLTAFAGSIGIIGISLILALSTGVNDYIKTVEEDTLSLYPLQIQSTGFDLSSMLEVNGGGGNREEGQINVIQMITNMFSKMDSNDLASLKKFLDSEESGISQYTNAIEYTYNIVPQIYKQNGDSIRQVNPDKSFESLGLGSSSSSSSIMSSMMGTDVFYQMPEHSSLYEGQYDVKAGRWPENYNECVLVLTSGGSISDFLLYTLGLRDSMELDEMIRQFIEEEQVETPENIGSYSYEDILGITFKLVNSCNYYQYDSQYQVWTDKSDDSAYMKQLVEQGEDLTIVGIVQPAEDANGALLTSGIAYPASLTEHVAQEAAQSEIVNAQLADRGVNVFTNTPFGETNSNQDFDMGSLITIDEEALKNAFSINPEKLTEGLSGSFDLSGLAQNMPDLSEAFTGSLGQGNLPEISMEELLSQVEISFSPQQIGQLFSRLLNGYEQSSLGSQNGFASLSEGFLTYLSSEEAQEILRENIMELLANSGITVSTQQLQAMFREILAGYEVYVREQGYTDPDRFGEYLLEYLQTDQGMEILNKWADRLLGEADAIEISPEWLETLAGELAAGYGAYAAQNGLPTLEQVQNSFSAYMETEEARQILAEGLSGMIDTSSMQEQIDAYLKQLMSSYSQSMEEALSSLSGQLTAQITASITQAVEQAAGQLGSNMEQAVTIDTEAFAGAFSMNMSAEEFSQLFRTMNSTENATYESNLRNLGYMDSEEPAGINIYPVDFESKEHVLEILDGYNSRMEAEGKEEQVITYTDMVGTLMSSVTDIIDIISYVLIAFVAISLVVSSIMIGVITYISVLERKKEIGILRAIGASKGNISQVFNAETFIIGLCAGLIGIGLTLLLLIPGNALIHHLAGTNSINAVLRPGYAVILIVLSVLLTLLGGLIPSRKAAKSDPVTALRTE